MKVVIAGSSGFLGTALRAALAEHGHDVTRLVRGEAPAATASRWDPARGQVDQSVIESADVVVNVAGAPIIRPWTAATREAIRSSRVSATRTLARAVAGCDAPPVLLAQSGTDWYGVGHGDTVLDESADTVGDALLARVTSEVEDATAEADQAGARVCQLRTGAVLDRRAGAMKLMLPFFRLGVAGRVGDGSQYFPVISLRDWVRAVLHLAQTDSARGPHNLVAPEPPTNAEFTAAMGQALHRPTKVAMPAVVFEKAFGELSQVLLNSLRVAPAKLQAEGFTFTDRTVDDVVAAALGRSGG
ncbi:MAG TPA: TIGR01777 family oxidoreductase [Nocardioidaceae bacterium]|nr:TIGR01777 family oxidoreductase [Nocardioidaceae bacterium]